jgi:hypothetical protein
VTAGVPYWLTNNMKFTAAYGSPPFWWVTMFDAVENFTESTATITNPR